VAEARKPASAIAWRSESSQRGSNARRLASAQPMHASTSTAATTTAAIAAAVNVSECVEACVTVRPAIVVVGVAGAVAVPAVAGALVAGAVAEGTVVAGTVVAGTVVAGTVVAGAVVDGAVVAGTDSLAGAVAVVTGGVVVAPAAEGLAVVECSLADAGIGKVGVELVFAAICP
jgi:hypothetical protein